MPKKAELNGSRPIFFISEIVCVHICTRLRLTSYVTVMTQMHYSDDHYMLRLLLYVPDHGTKHNF